MFGRAGKGKAPWPGVGDNYAKVIRYNNFGEKKEPGLATGRGSGVSWRSDVRRI